ncbi:MAG: LytTR family transcriptional regulator DNA-binding domain-containing protein [Hominilimicola sp.]
MTDKISKFFVSKNIKPENIKYIVHQGKKTEVFLLDGEIIETWISLKDIYAYLPQDKFLNIQKGIVVNASQIVNISSDGVYTMTDGHVFQGRKRCLSEHKKVRKTLGLDATPLRSDEYVPPLGLLEKCTLLDEMPLAFCIIELVFDENGRGVDFVFRYCNKKMEDIEGAPISEMLNHSFYEVFKNGDKKWLVTYANVALNGKKRTITDYSPEIDKQLTIYCYQPSPGYCACVLIPVTSTPQLIQAEH